MLKPAETEKLDASRTVLYITIFLALCLIVLGVLYWRTCQERLTNSSLKKTTIPKQVKVAASTLTATTIEPRNDYEIQMVQAAIAYWSDKYGSDGAQILLKNYGCHAAVEVVKDGNKICTLGYDGTKITEINVKS